MRQKISIDQLQVGLYLEVDVSETVKGSAKQNVKLLAKGMLITTGSQAYSSQEPARHSLP